MTNEPYDNTDDVNNILASYRGDTIAQALLERISRPKPEGFVNSNQEKDDTLANRLADYLSRES